MAYEEYDRVLLKDGREGTVMSVCGPDEYYLDVGHDVDTWDNIHVNGSDIERKA